MESEKSTFEIIESYDRNLMSLEERNAFEARCKNDPDFREEVRAYAMLKRALLAEKENKNLQRSSNTEKTHKLNIVRNVWTQKRKILAISIAAVVLILIYVLPRNKSNTASSTQDLYSEYFYISPSAVRGETDKQWQDAFNDFNNKDYVQAIERFEEILKNSELILKLENETYLYLSICYLNQDKYKEALHNLKEISPDSYLHLNEAKWWRLGVYLKMGDIELSKNSIADCLTTDNFYKRQEVLNIKEALSSD